MGVRRVQEKPPPRQAGPSHGPAHRDLPFGSPVPRAMPGWFARCRMEVRAGNAGVSAGNASVSAGGSARVPHCCDSVVALATPRSIKRTINERVSLPVPLARAGGGVPPQPQPHPPHGRFLPDGTAPPQPHCAGSSSLQSALPCGWVRSGWGEKQLPEKSGLRREVCAER